MNAKCLVFVFLLLGGFALFAQENGENDKILMTKAVESQDDSVSYEIEIIDLGFKAWLLSQAKPMSYYSLVYLENWNRQYVLEWNHRYQTFANPNVVESYIDYDAATNYGLEVNYKLYCYFVYVEDVLKIKLLNRSVK
jgi:hypothetical protein